MNTHRVGIFGASGYTGAELLRYLAAHPSFEVVWATADSNAGRPLGEVFPHVVGFESVVLQPMDPSAAPDMDLAFLALPHGAAAEHGRALVARGIKVVDFSADWRLQDAQDYERWYRWTHPSPADLGTWTYGLPERNREAIANSSAVANPGCYPTAALLALTPVVESGLVQGDGIVISAVSGVSGAGRKADVGYAFSELDGSVVAYGVGTHRHTPEIEQELSRAAGRAVTVTFTPHLVPMARGELVTCHAKLSGEPTELRARLEAAYKAEPFVHVLPAGTQPATKHAAGTNHAFVGVAVDEHSGTAVVTCAIDNLGKGASGQAVQNANLMLGLPETAGLKAIGVYP